MTPSWLHVFTAGYHQVSMTEHCRGNQCLFKQRQIHCAQNLCAKVFQGAQHHMEENDSQCCYLSLQKYIQWRGHLFNLESTGGAGLFSLNMRLSRPCASVFSWVDEYIEFRSWKEQETILPCSKEWEMRYCGFIFQPLRCCPVACCRCLCKYLQRRDLSGTDILHPAGRANRNILSVLHLCFHFLLVPVLLWIFLPGLDVSAAKQPGWGIPALNWLQNLQGEDQVARIVLSLKNLMGGPVLGRVPREGTRTCQSALASPISGATPMLLYCCHYYCYNVSLSLETPNIRLNWALTT